MSNVVGWFEIYVDDMDRAKAFYQAVFELELEKLPNPTEYDVDMWAFPADDDAYGAPGALVKMPDMPAGGGNVLVYFSCEDCAEEESRVEVAGGKVEQPKMSIGEYGFVTLVVDTEGNMFGLHSRQ